MFKNKHSGIKTYSARSLKCLKSKDKEVKCKICKLDILPDIEIYVSYGNGKTKRYHLECWDKIRI